MNSPKSLMGIHPWGQTGSSVRETALKWEKHGFLQLSTNASAAPFQGVAGRACD